MDVMTDNPNLDYQIRPFVMGDMPAILSIEAASFGQDAWKVDEFMGLLDYDDTVFLVAAKQDSLIGYCCGILDDNEGYIASIAVGPNVRQAGIGTALLNAVCQQLAEQGGTSAALHVRVSNEAAVQLYKKLGFLVEATIPNYYEDDEAAYYMARC
jgi:[ribosomal protein S18]-alanine N-acetyltransferase